MIPLKPSPAPCGVCTQAAYSPVLSVYRARFDKRVYICSIQCLKQYQEYLIARLLEGKRK
jgi:hypothetical protein